jgi:hypothetical protein
MIIGVDFHVIVPFDVRTSLQTHRQIDHIGSTLHPSIGNLFAM